MEPKSKFGDYYLGLDIGTDSLGWAVTDENYNILQFNRKAMWGIHLFESGNTAEERRKHRTARRRLERRKQRIALLRELFSEEICKVDPAFFERMDESGLHPEDRFNKKKFELFGEPLSDKTFHIKYPTLYHLRQDMMSTKSKPDIRLVYLAMHHIIKYRGHFLFKGVSDDDIPQFEKTFTKLLGDVNNLYGFEISADNNLELIKETFLDEQLGVTDKGKRLGSLVNANDPGEKALMSLLSGSKLQVSKIFDDEELGKIKFSLKDPNFSEVLEEHESLLGDDRVNTLLMCKAIYDWTVLFKILKGSNSISEAKIKEYQQHKDDLKLLKRMVRRCAPNKYSEMFRSKKTRYNYCEYVNEYGDKIPDKRNQCSQEEFCKYVRDVLKDPTIYTDKSEKDMLFRLENGTFMPKQTSKDNSVIPFSEHKKELRKIIENLSQHYGFLQNKDEDGLTTGEKILLLQEFRIPYYVGPLDDRSNKAWLVRKSHEKITPWNFNKVVDVDESSTRFIDNLTNMCTYLHGEKVVPKCSLLYSRYELYNELNNLRINGEKINVELRNSITMDLFENVGDVKKVTKKTIHQYLMERHQASRTDEITGIDNEIKSSLRSHILIRNIIGDKISDRRMVEGIIKTISIFGDERARLKKKLTSDLSDKLSVAEIEELSKLQFSGWGRFSEKLLTGLYQIDKQSGISKNIMTYLEETNDNFIEILHKYSFNEKIDGLNSSLMRSNDGKIEYGLVKDLYVSPAVRRSIWRTLDVVQDIIKVTRRPPKKIFVETTREKRESKRTMSRKDQLLQLFKKCKEDDWANDVEKEGDDKLRGRSLYLYYVQHGKCMYCGGKIDINDLGNNEAVDRDHIYPQSKIKDDSIHNNMVLVHKSCNQQKSDNYPISPEVQNNMRAYWKWLKDSEFISSEKFKRLTRSEELTEEELSGFINRQIVQVSQSVKGVISVLKSVFRDESDIIYAKGSNVSEFRNEFGLTKCRSVNDYHHAKDAYLNIVVGNVYDTKFTSNPVNFIKSKEPYNIGRMYDRKVSRNGKDAWIPGKEGTRATVEKYVNRNNILFTRFATESKGELFDLNPLKKDDKLFRKKDGMDPGKYGGYNSEKGAFFSLVEYDHGKKKIRSIEAVPIHVANKDPDSDMLKNYFEGQLEASDLKILIRKIKMKSLFEIGGARCHVTGRSDNRLVFMCGIQLIITNELYDYCKGVYKYIENEKNREKRPIDGYNFSAEMNIKLYDLLLSKSENSIYRTLLGTLANNLKERKQDFLSSELEVQVKTLDQILHAFQCNPVHTDLKIIGGGATGIIRKNKKISDSKESVKLIFQSPSGLFEKEIDLSKI